MSTSEEKTEAAVQNIKSCLESLGFVVSVAKLVLDLYQALEDLGLFIQSAPMTFSLMEKKASEFPKCAVCELQIHRDRNHPSRCARRFTTTSDGIYEAKNSSRFKSSSTSSSPRIFSTSRPPRSCPSTCLKKRWGLPKSSCSSLSPVSTRTP